MKNEMKYIWDEESGVATCLIPWSENKDIVGVSICCAEDQDMKSEKTGMHIAEQRAMIGYLKAIRDEEIKPKIAALKQLYYSINKSKEFNPKSYEARMLNRQIRLLESDYDYVRAMIKQTQKDLSYFIKTKEELYKKVRRNRKAKEN